MTDSLNSPNRLPYVVATRESRNHISYQTWPEHWFQSKIDDGSPEHMHLNRLCSITYTQTVKVTTKYVLTIFSYSSNQIMFLNKIQTFQLPYIIHNVSKIYYNRHSKSCQNLNDYGVHSARNYTCIDMTVLHN